MAKRSLDPVTAGKLYESIQKDPGRLPVRFFYGGEEVKGLPGAEVSFSEGSRILLKKKMGDRLTASAEVLYNAEFGELEYTLFFENPGTAPSEVIGGFELFRMDLPGEDPVLRGCLGDHENYYAAYEHDLLKSDRYFRSTEGRSTHIVFPYFDLVHGDGGTMFALGWAGTWEALFAAHDGVTAVSAKTVYDLNGCLLPGEKIRTGLLVLLPYRNRDYADATNLWREWFMKNNLPKADREGNALEPFSTMCFASDTGLPNSDGSISERSTTWKPTLEKIISENLKIDFRWFDAGWYQSPAKETVPVDWWGTIGTWEKDPVKWPGNTLFESNEACRKAGMRSLCWFEPERVTDLVNLEKNYGYKKEWGIVNGNVITSNIGDEECLKWTLDRVTKALSENGFDLYREDNNSDPGFAWNYLDESEKEKYGVPRSGINESKCIDGHYRLWDGILAYCRANGKCAFLDSCASGGGRNDVESLRRAIPFMRSDYDRTTIAMRLSQTSSFCRWVPFHGSSTKETLEQHEDMKGAGADAYVTRASFLPVYNLTPGAISHDPEIDFDMMRRNFEEWRSVQHLLTRDFYVLTPWHHELDRYGFTAFAYDAPETGESVLLLFRQEEAAAENFTARLQFAEDGADYVLTDADSGESEVCSGKKLREGIEFTLPEKRSSRLISIKKIREA